MTYDEIIEQLEVTKSKIKEIARNEYGGESWNDDLDALTEAADIVADYSKATAQASVQLRMRTGKRNARSKDRDREVDQEGSEAHQVRPEAGRPKMLSNHEPRRTPEEAATQDKR